MLAVAATTYVIIYIYIKRILWKVVINYLHVLLVDDATTSDTYKFTTSVFFDNITS